MQQHERPDRDHDAEQRRGLERERRQFGGDCIIARNQQQQELQDFDEGERGGRGTNQSQGLVTPVIAEQTEQEEQPR